jgi:Predicted integral membrane protein (DUF2269)
LTGAVSFGHPMVVPPADVMQLLHVIAAFAFVAGLVGRDLILGAAGRADDLSRITTLLHASEPFERHLVRTGSILVLVFGLLAWRAEELPLWGTGTRWVTVSLIAFASLVPLVPLVFLPRGKVFDAALIDAEATGAVTPALTAAFRDPAVAAARWYELAIVAFIILLMVTKPF